MPGRTALGWAIGTDSFIGLLVSWHIEPIRQALSGLLVSEASVHDARSCLVQAISCRKSS
jgi:hypothetical protein